MRFHPLYLLAPAVAVLAIACSPESSAPAGPTGLNATAEVIDSNGKRVRNRIDLIATPAFPGAKGPATFTTKTTGERELQMSVQELTNMVGEPIRFYIGSTKIGTAFVNSLGKAGLSRSTQLGQEVPLAVAGQVAEARTVLEETIVTGSF